MMSSVPRRIGKYELQELLGRGGMAEVWKATDTQLRRSVALKFMHANLSTDPDFVTRFIREAQTIAALHHPNIVQIYDFHASEQDDELGVARTDVVAYMVMEYIKGQTLAHYIAATSRKQEFPDAATLIRLFTPISLALDYAHRQGAIHRDIKPANILLDQNNTTRNVMGEPILSDFGLAKVVGESTQTVSGTVLGTPLYMSPEQIQGKAVGPRSDLYSLAVILYEVCAGAPPFRAESLTGIMLQHLNEPPPAPNLLNPRLPPALTPVLMKSLAKAPTDRYPSAAAMLAAVATAFKAPIPDEIRAALNATEQPEASETVVSAPPTDERASLEPTLHAGQATVASSGVDEDDEHTVIAQGSGASGKPAVALSSASTALAAPPNMRREAQAPRVRRQVMAAAPSALPDSPEAPASPPSLRQRAFGQLHGWRLAVAAVMLIALVGSGVGAYLALTHHTSAATSAITTVGQAYFMSSGQMNQDATQGINDQFQITLHGIPAPTVGNAYYAWLLPDANNSEGADILLGRLTVANGAIHYIYPGDGQHANLLAVTSRFLVTEESAAQAPLTPSPNLSDWKYYAALPQTIPSGQKYSLLDHLRHLLAKDPDLEPLGLHGGLNVWNYREAQQVAQWAFSARNEWNAQEYNSLRNTVVMMLDYLDGSQFVRPDVPAGTPILADPQISQVGLLEFDPATQNPPGYLYHIALHLNGVLQSPGATTFQRNQARTIDTALANVRRWLGEARHDAMQMVSMDNAQLAQSSTQTLLNDLVSVTTNAFQGHVTPTTHQLDDGVSQLFVLIQRLANFAVVPYRQ